MTLFVTTDRLNAEQFARQAGLEATFTKLPDRWEVLLQLPSAPSRLEPLVLLDELWDLSRWNDPVNFLALATDPAFRGGWLRGTLGATGLDDRYKSYWPAAVAAKFDYLGMYHLFVTEAEGERQHDNIFQVTKGDLGNLRLVVDVEPLSSDGVAMFDAKKAERAAVRLKKLLEMLTVTLGYKPLVYTAAWAIERMGLTRATWLREYPLFCAHYTTRPEPFLPEPWRSAKIAPAAHQYDNGEMGYSRPALGVPGRIDRSKVRQPALVMRP